MTAPTPTPRWFGKSDSDRNMQDADGENLADPALDALADEIDAALAKHPADPLRQGDDLDALADQARDALDGLGPNEECVVPPGWKLVPVAATENMVRAARDARPYSENDGDRLLMDANSEFTWDNMLAAAPEPPISAPVERSAASKFEPCDHRSGCGRVDECMAEQRCLGREEGNTDPTEYDTKSLLDALMSVYARSCTYQTRGLHDRWVELRREVERRLQAAPKIPPAIEGWRCPVCLAAWAGPAHEPDGPCSARPSLTAQTEGAKR